LRQISRVRSSLRESFVAHANTAIVTILANDQTMAGNFRAFHFNPRRRVTLRTTSSAP